MSGAPHEKVTLDDVCAALVTPVIFGGAVDCNTEALRSLSPDALIAVTANRYSAPPLSSVRVWLIATEDTDGVEDRDIDACASA